MHPSTPCARALARPARRPRGHRPRRAQPAHRGGGGLADHRGGPRGLRAQRDAGGAAGHHPGGVVRGLRLAGQRRSARRLGLEPTMILALLLSMSGELLRALADGRTGVPRRGRWSRSGGLGMGNVLLPPLVKRYFPDRIGDGHGGVLGGHVRQHGRPAPGGAAGGAGRGLARVGRRCGRSSGSRPSCRGWSSSRSPCRRARTCGRPVRRAPRADRPARAGPRGRAGDAHRVALAAGLGAGADVLRQHHRHLRAVRVAAADPGRRRPRRRRRRAMARRLRDPRPAGRPRLARSLTARMRNPYPLVVGFVACWVVGLRSG